jgi:hypothetical protein
MTGSPGGAPRSPWSRSRRTAGALSGRPWRGPGGRGCGGGGGRPGAAGGWGWEGPREREPKGPPCQPGVSRELPGRPASPGPPWQLCRAWTCSLDAGRGTGGGGVGGVNEDLQCDACSRVARPPPPSPSPTTTTRKHPPSPPPPPHPTRRWMSILLTLVRHSGWRGGPCRGAGRACLVAGRACRAAGRRRESSMGHRGGARGRPAYD